MDHDCLEVMIFSLFHLGGNIMCPSLVFSLLGKWVLLGNLMKVHAFLVLPDFVELV
jgi:hypothetical protein